MKTNTASANLQEASIHDYQSGASFGKGIVDMDAYNLWKSGHSEVCEAFRCVGAMELKRLNIPADAAIFIIE